MKQLLKRFQASQRVALDISRDLWMRPEVPVEMLTKQGGILLRWRALQTLGGARA